MKKKILKTARIVLPIAFGVSALIILLVTIDMMLSYSGVSSFMRHYPDSYWLSDDGEMYIYVDKDYNATLHMTDDDNTAYEFRQKGRSLLLSVPGTDGEHWGGFCCNDEKQVFSTSSSGVTDRAYTTFYRVQLFDVNEYISRIGIDYKDDNGNVVSGADGGSFAVNDPCAAVSAAKEELCSSSLSKYAKYEPYRVYYDKHNGYWLVKTSYRCIKIYGKEYFRTTSACVVIRALDGSVAGSYVNVN